MLTKVISGGQSGVDIAALQAAKELGIATGGWMPARFLTEHGFRREYADLYGMRELLGGDYADRTLRNVQESDGTLIVTNVNPLVGGTRLTAVSCAQFRKPYFVALLDDNPAAVLFRAEDALDWLKRENIQTLNAAGPRESKSPGIFTAARAFLLEVFRLAK